jgi:hypothetical protein
MPDLSGLANNLLGDWVLSSTFIASFPPGPAAFLVSTFVRLVEDALRSYEEARSRLETASREEHLVEFVRGCSDMEDTFWVLHRATRVAVALVRSPETKLDYSQVPAEADREKLRKMRNAIDHDEEPIVGGCAGKGDSLALEVRSNEMSITDRDGVVQTVTHDQFAGWIRTLHALAAELIAHPRDWAK